MSDLDRRRHERIRREEIALILEGGGRVRQQGAPPLESDLLRIEEGPSRSVFGNIIHLRRSHIYAVNSEHDVIRQSSLIGIMRAFFDIVKRLCDERILVLSPEDSIQVVFKLGDTYVSTPVRKVKDFHVSQAFVALYDFAQSNNEHSLEHGVQVEIITVTPYNNEGQVDDGIRGGGGDALRITSSLSAAYQKRSCIAIPNFSPEYHEEIRLKFAKQKKAVPLLPPSDNMCLARCVCVIKKQAQLEDDLEKLRYARLSKKEKQSKERVLKNGWKQYTDKRTPRFLTADAVELCNMIGISSMQKCGIPELQLMEVAAEMNIKIIGGDLLNSIVYKGSTKFSRTGYVFRTVSSSGLYHYDVVTNVRAFYAKRFYCSMCDAGFQRYNQHRCKDVLDWCFTCFQRACEVDVNFRVYHCYICQKPIRSDVCSYFHEANARLCLIVQCRFCKTDLKREKIGERWETNREVLQRHGECKVECNICKAEVSVPTHMCYMQQKPFQPPVSKVVYLDFESDQSTGEHVPVYCYMKWIFSNGITGTRAFGIHGNVKQEVGDFLFNNKSKEKFKGAVVVAHNMKGYDGCFLLRYLVENNMKPSNVLAIGTKLIAFSVKERNMRIIDSLSFLPMPLADITKAFGLDVSTHTKGFFPHFFTRIRDRLNYVGPLPGKEYYGYSTMSVEKQKEFDEWYETKKDEVFDFQKELKLYCKQDVLILAEGMEAFRKVVGDITKDLWQRSTLNHATSRDPLYCDPLAYNTLASLCHAIYKACFLEENTIALVPPGGYINHRYSNVALEWLEYLRIHEGVDDLIHAGNSSTSECKIGPYRVDGYSPSRKTIYEFYGCYYHGHEQCIKGSFTGLHPFYKLTYKGLHEKMQEREQELLNQNYTVVSIWECEWKDFKSKHDLVTNSIVREMKGFVPINVRDSFKGGRTETFKMFDEVNVENGERIGYVDVNSLYPYVISTKTYPVGHPVIEYGSSDTDVHTIFGFVKCKILPPTNLYHPVLPYTVNGKLLFPLCALCAETMDNAYCRHSCDERALVGTWFSEEVKLAISEGYKILKVYQTMHFKRSSNEMFANYIRTFYKMKVVAGGFPSSCVSELDKKAYVQRLNDVEGFNITVDEIELNPAKKSLAKLMCNAFWGRFALREIQRTTRFITERDELIGLLESSSITISTIRPISENMLCVQYSVKSPELVQLTNNTNLYIASATTAYARMELYSYMRQCYTSDDKSTSSVLYCDTDSILYRYSEECNPVITEPFLGKMENELRQGEFIVRFISGGPKNYAYETNRNRSCVKVKGFTLHGTNRGVFTLNVLKELIDVYVLRKSEGQSVVCTRKQKQNIASKLDDICDDSDDDFDYDGDDELSTSNAQVLYVEGKGIITRYKNRIIRNALWKLLSRDERKFYSVYFDKRVVLPTFDTVPFGYKQN